MISGSAGTDALSLLAAASSSQETQANLERLQKAQNELNGHIEQNRNLLRQQEDNQRKAEEHLRQLSDAIDQKAKAHQAKIENDLASVSSRQQKVNSDMSAAQDARSKADQHLKAAEVAHNEANQRSVTLDAREQSLSRRESELSVREASLSKREAEYGRKSDQLKAFLS